MHYQDHFKPIWNRIYLEDISKGCFKYSAVVHQTIDFDFLISCGHETREMLERSAARLLSQIHKTELLHQISTFGLAQFWLPHYRKGTIEA